MTRFFQQAATEFLRAKHILATRLFNNGKPPQGEQNDANEAETRTHDASSIETNRNKKMAAPEENHVVHHDYTVR